MTGVETGNNPNCPSGHRRRSSSECRRGASNRCARKQCAMPAVSLVATSGTARPIFTGPLNKSQPRAFRCRANAPRREEWESTNAFTRVRRASKYDRATSATTVCTSSVEKFDWSPDWLPATHTRRKLAGRAIGHRGRTTLLGAGHFDPALQTVPAPLAPTALRAIAVWRNS
jgi:hypothetical protein